MKKEIKVKNQVVMKDIVMGITALAICVVYNINIPHKIIIESICLVVLIIITYFAFSKRREVFDEMAEEHQRKAINKTFSIVGIFACIISLIGLILKRFEIEFHIDLLTAGFFYLGISHIVSGIEFLRLEKFSPCEIDE